MNQTPAALVIGAGDATGGAIARAFAREGYAACVVRRSADKLQPLVAQIEAEGGIAHAFGTDARKEEEVVAQGEAGKDAGHLEVALQAHPFHRAVELAKVRPPAAGAVGPQQPGLAGFFPVTHGNVDDEFLFPADEGVAQQAGDVVGDGAVHGILKVQHRQGAALLQRHHQVSGHEIAVHKDAGRGQVVRHDEVEGVVQRGLLLVGQRHAAVAGQVPVWEQR